MRRAAQKVITRPRRAISHVSREFCERIHAAGFMSISNTLRNEGVDAGARAPGHAKEPVANSLVRGRLPVRHAGVGARSDTVVSGLDYLSNSIGALVGKQAGDPATHRGANDIAALDAEGVLELSDEVRDVSERVFPVQ